MSYETILAERASLADGGIFILTRHYLRMSKYYESSPQHVVLTELFDNDEWILDFGGGGEGIIGQLMGPRVIAVDRLESELQEALERGCPALPVVMDGADLKFLDNTFQNATAFYSLMFVKAKDLPPVIKEIYRVMKPGGTFIVWESEFAMPEGAKEEIIAFELTVELPSGKTIETGYGTRRKKQTLAYIQTALEKAGFTCLKVDKHNNQFVMTLQKPSK